MDGELQQLIERIKKDAVDAGRQEAEALLVEARAQAALLVREAEQKAATLVEQAEQESKRFAERSQHTLQQASRDLLITIGKGVESILADLAIEAATEALGPDTVSEMLVRIAAAYPAAAGREVRIEAFLNPADQAAVVEHFRKRYGQALSKGLTLHPQGDVVKGFRLRVEGQRVLHDFTREAIAEALSNFLRPHLAEIVTRAARGASES